MSFFSDREVSKNVLNDHSIQDPEIKALISQLDQLNQQAANLIEGKEPDQDDAKDDDTKVDDTKEDDTKIDDPRVDDPKVDDSKVDDAKVDDAKVDDTEEDKPKTPDNKCDYVPGKLVAGPNVSHGLNNSG